MKQEGPLKVTSRCPPHRSIICSLPCAGRDLAFPSGTLLTWVSGRVGFASPLGTFRTLWDSATWKSIKWKEGWLSFSFLPKVFINIGTTTKQINLLTHVMAENIDPFSHKFADWLGMEIQCSIVNDRRTQVPLAYGNDSA